MFYCSDTIFEIRNNEVVIAFSFLQTRRKVIIAKLVNVCGSEVRILFSADSIIPMNHIVDTEENMGLKYELKYLQ